jgi:very-short-patch-repair endonuclease
MRREPTEPEKRLWRNLSNRQLDGHEFRRQTTIEPFIADFLCPAKALIVEVDGEPTSPKLMLAAMPFWPVVDTRQSASPMRM